tara:strand:- start:1340 stop:1855 length:516 start_codon:yes stop_codon:yes gene_type:complete
MTNLFADYRKNYLPFLLIFILVFSRLIPHPPNFTPIIAAAIISTHLFKNIWSSSFILLASMLLSDLFIGLHWGAIYVYISLFIIIVFQSVIAKKISLKNLIFYCFVSSLIFFILTNLGVWAFSNMYEKNINGLFVCYILAIPFFTNTIISTIFFSYLAYMVVNYGFKKKYS